MTENDKDIYLKLKKSSWKNFFRVMSNRKNSIELVDGSSLGNFGASIQYLEQQFNEKANEDTYWKALEKKYDKDYCKKCKNCVLIERAKRRVKDKLINDLEDLKKKLSTRPYILDHYCPYCKRDIAEGKHIELREYAYDEKHDWHRVVCSHLLHVYSPPEENKNVVWE